MAKRVVFSDEARADIRAIDRETAWRPLKALGSRRAHAALLCRINKFLRCWAVQF
jgi:hypothetical protein